MPVNVGFMKVQLNGREKEKKGGRCKNRGKTSEWKERRTEKQKDNERGEKKEF